MMSMPLTYNINTGKIHKICEQTMCRADLNTGDLVTASEVLGVGGTAFGGSAHSVLVILAYENARKVPQFCLIVHNVRL
jgi:hypothetical protein